MRGLIVAAAAALTTVPGIAAADQTVYFAIDSARIDAAGMESIAAAAEEYRTEGETAVSVVGHTDTTASPEYNFALSRRRAEAVSAELVARGVPSDAITTAGRGESDLAVTTGDGVSEARNRRAVITVDLAATPMAPVLEPAASTEWNRWTVGVGPYVAFNNESGEEGWYVGGNLVASYHATPNVVVSGEQAVFWAFGADKEGVGSRTALGLDYDFSGYGLGDGIVPYVGANVGYLTVDGSSRGGFFAGPEIGLQFHGFTAKVAYDFVDDRDAGEGVISATLGYVVQF